MARKPEPIGTEFKCIADAILGVMLFIEVTRAAPDKTPLGFDEVKPKIKSNAKCTMRMAKAVSTMKTCDKTSPLFLGDSWFGTLDCCVQMKSKIKADTILVIKQGCSFFPKAFFERNMSHWATGTHMVLEANHKGVDLIALGYKYRQRDIYSLLDQKVSDDVCLFFINAI